MPDLIPKARYGCLSAISGVVQFVGFCHRLSRFLVSFSFAWDIKWIFAWNCLHDCQREFCHLHLLPKKKHGTNTGKITTVSKFSCRSLIKWIQRKRQRLLSCVAVSRYFTSWITFALKLFSCTCWLILAGSLKIPPKDMAILAVAAQVCGLLVIIPTGETVRTNMEGRSLFTLGHF